MVSICYDVPTSLVLYTKHSSLNSLKVKRGIQSTFCTLKELFPYCTSPLPEAYLNDLFYMYTNQ